MRSNVAPESFERGTGKITEGVNMETTAVLLKGPKDLALDVLQITPPSDGDLVIEVNHSGISTGTEKLFWSGAMPPFPGMGFPLVPGYESMGEVIEAPMGSMYKAGDTVFVPGANCYEGAFGLFGGALPAPPPYPQSRCLGSQHLQASAWPPDREPWPRFSPFSFPTDSAVHRLAQSCFRHVPCGGGVIRCARNWS